MSVPQGAMSGSPSVTLKRLKFLVQAVAVELDSEGNPVGERTTQPQAFYSQEQVLAFCAEFDESLVRENQSETNGSLDEPQREQMQHPRRR